MAAIALPADMERRSRMRYPLILRVRYRTLGRKNRRTGAGQAVNLSSGGALVVSQHELAVGAELEVRMEWPPLLNGRIPLQLVAVARVVRCGESSFAVCFRRHKFYTVGKGAESLFSVDPLKLTPAAVEKFKTSIPLLTAKY
jgi:hypothetical protein